MIEQKAEMVGRMSVVSYCARVEFGARFSYENKKHVPTPQCLLLAVRDRRNCGPVLRIGLCWIDQKGSGDVGKSRAQDRADNLLRPVVKHHLRATVRSVRQPCCQDGLANGHHR